MTEHAPLPPSGAATWVKCTAWPTLSKQYPEQEESSDAAEGTAVHWFISETLSGRTPGGTAPNGVLLTDEMRGHAQVFIDAVGGRPVKVESRVDCPSIHPDNWGTPDAYVRDEATRTVDIWDFKYGWGIVEEYENWQLIDYASGVYDRIGPEAIDWTFRLHVVQPRPWHRHGPVRTWTVRGPELRTYFRTLRSAAEEASGNNPQTVVGPYCKHCTARHACKAVRGGALDAADTAYDATPDELTPIGLSVELAILARAAAVLEARRSGLEAQAMAAIRSGGDVPGWTIEHTPGREEWVKPATEVLALGQMFGVSLTKPLEAITPNQARKAGVSAEVIAAYSQRKSGSANLVQVNMADARRAFGG